MIPDRGDGPICPEGHGRTYRTDKGHWWCPVSQTLFDSADHGHAIGPVLRPSDKDVPERFTITVPALLP